MKDKILSVLKSCKGRAGYYGCTMDYLMQQIKFLAYNPYEVMQQELVLMERRKEIYLTRSTQENNRGEIVLICYRDSLNDLCLEGPISDEN